MKTTAAFFSFTVLSLMFIGSLSAAPARTIYESVLKEGSLRKKKELGSQLGYSKDPKAGFYTDKLLFDENYWNQHAGISSAVIRKDKKTDAAMMKVFATDHMVSGRIAKIVEANPARYEDLLLKAYTPGELSSDDVLETLSRLDSEKSFQFVVGIAKNPEHDDHTDAKKALENASGRSALTFFRKNTGDQELRITALKFLVKNGNPSDLPVFQEILDTPAASKSEFSLAVQAHSQWASAEDKKDRYIRLLKSDDPFMVRAAIAAYSEEVPLTDEILDRLKYQNAKSKSQSVRFESALAMTRTLDRSIVPYLIESLYIPYETKNKTTGIDLAMGLITLGIVPVLKGLSENSNRRNFYSNRRKITDHLTKMTGQSWKETEDWKNWAIDNGYTVAGENLAARLFSGNREIRQKAVQRSLEILQFKTEEEYRKKKNPTGNIRASLAADLEESGFLREKKYQN